jgi:GAF domain-containing protein/HAMP domain-containing protein
MNKITKLRPSSSSGAVDTITTQARRAFGIGIAAMVAALLVIIHMTYLIVRYGYWQMYYVIGTVVLFIALSFAAVLFSRRGRATLSGWLIISGIFITVVVLSLFVRNIGGEVSIIGLFAILYVAIETLPQRQVQWATFLGVLALVLTRLLDAFPLLSTASDASLERVIQITVVIALFILSILIIREFSSLSLTNKLLVTFLVVALVVTYSANYFNQNRISSTLTDNAGNTLNSLVKNQAQAIGDVLASELNSLTSLSLGSFMQTQVLAANAKYPSDPGEILKTVSDNDRLWKEALAAQKFSEPLIRASLNNDIAEELKLFTSIFPSNYDMSLTDVYGGLLASTGLVSSYYQGIQFWWQTTNNNGTGQVYISAPVYESSLKKNVIIIAIPVRDRDTQKVIGILRTTYVLTAIEDLVNNIRVGQTGFANIYFPSAPTQYIRDGQLLLADTDFLDQVSKISGNSYGEIVYQGKQSYVSQASIQPATPNQQIEKIGWWLVVQQDRSELLAPITRQTQQADLLSSLIVGVVSGLAILLAQFLAGPILRLTQTAEQIRTGDLTARASVEADDEVGNLASSFNSMTYQLRQTLQGLEHRVTERTRELTLSAQVSRALSQERDLDQLLSTAVNMIQETFSLYYTQIYLTDPTGRVLLLKSGYGEVGEELIRRAHRLPVGAGSINGEAAFEKKPVLVSDTTSSATFKPNPLLPNTRSEMAVPLLVGYQLVGVLDMQSEQVGAFSGESLPAFESLAGQLAVAVENASLFDQAQTARLEMETQARRLTREGWQGFLDAIERKERIGFSFEEKKVYPLEGQMVSPIPAPNSLSVPIEVIGEQLGTIQFEKEDPGSWSEDDRTLVSSVATQIARQIDNLRLLAQAEQYRREAESAARQLTREGWSDFIKELDETNLGFVYDQQQVLPAVENPSEDGSATIVQPIEIRGEKLGEISLDGVQLADEKSVELIATITNRLAEHIESLRLSAQTHSALMDTEALYSIIARINSAESYGDILTTLSEATLFSEADQLMIMGIFDRPMSETQVPEWIFPVAHKSNDDIEIAQRYPFNAFESVPHTLFTEQPAILRNLNNDHRLDKVTRTLFKEVFNSQSSIIVPLVLGNQIIGFFQGYFSNLTEFPDHEIHRLVAVAGQVAIAVQSLILLEQAQARARQEQRIREVSAQVFSAVDVNAIMQKAVEQVGRALGAPAYIYLGQNRSTNEVS